jgi:hypothetical protein
MSKFIALLDNGGLVNSDMVGLFRPDKTWTKRLSLAKMEPSLAIAVILRRYICVWSLFQLRLGLSCWNISIWVGPNLILTN